MCVIIRLMTEPEQPRPFEYPPTPPGPYPPHDPLDAVDALKGGGADILDGATCAVPRFWVPRLALALLPGRLGIVAAWVFNLWGSADILHANYEGIHLGVQAGQMGAAYFLPTFIVPLFLITHGLMFWLLLRNESEAGEPAAWRPG